MFIMANLSLRILLAAVDNVHAKYFATFCITSGTYTVIGLVIAWCTSNIIVLNSIAVFGANALDLNRFP